MSGLDKIIAHITEEGAVRAEEILKEGCAEAERITAEGKRKTFEECERIAKKADQEAKVISQRATASAELKTKQILLAGRQELIGETIEKAYSAIEAMDDGEYVELIRRIFTGHVPCRDACIKFNSRDILRMPSEVVDEFVKMSASNGAVLTVSEEAVDIPNGFILDFGGIEENCSLSALIEQNKEEIEDRINSKLFG